MATPTEEELVNAIADAGRQAILQLFREHPETFYYCALITTGEAHAPFLAAWSVEALERAASSADDPETERKYLKWSYADSPFCCYGEEYFDLVNARFAKRPLMNYQMEEQEWAVEYELRLSAMEKAVAQLDSEGLFGRGKDREAIYINVEVMPPDYTNTERARRLNPPQAIAAWLEEAAEPS
ncbi:DUF4303 domain-containing protein [Gimesia fumaroli]|uniref:DUF4303 domain-containing protein n=1 Tax=Gimesia fumaroli TaxID=2527976 RepID=A0A518IFC1_9PLAN|nr:DUF4303 domain-containing protein [Gimesia fumaroli]QDV51760.1 hypothetical protein Enr17x_38180 [Gimesia fumaroli]